MSEIENETPPVVFEATNGTQYTQDELDAVAMPKDPITDQVLGVVCSHCGSAIVGKESGHWVCSADCQPS